MVQEAPPATLLGIVGALLGVGGCGVSFAGCVMAPSALLPGLVMFLIGILLGATGQRKRNYLKCISCRKKRQV